jgi:hypothetical protein
MTEMCSHLAPVIRRSGDTLTHPFFEEHIYDSLGLEHAPCVPARRMLLATRPRALQRPLIYKSF